MFKYKWERIRGIGVGVGEGFKGLQRNFRLLSLNCIFICILDLFVIICWKRDFFIYLSLVFLNVYFLNNYYVLQIGIDILEEEK